MFDTISSWNGKLIPKIAVLSPEMRDKSRGKFKKTSFWAQITIFLQQKLPLCLPGFSTILPNHPQNYPRILPAWEVMSQ
jgi:hypothetical protein